MVNTIYDLDLISPEGEIIPIVSPIISDNCGVGMLAPIVPIPAASFSLFATLSYKTWFFLLASTLFVSSVSIRNPKKGWRLNFDLCLHFLGQGVKCLGKSTCKRVS